MRKINLMFVLIIGTALSVGFWSLVSGSPFKRQQPKVITLMLRVEEVEIVLKGLGKLPLEESGNIFFNVKNQAERQMSAPPDTTGKKKEEPKTKKN